MSGVSFNVGGIHDFAADMPFINQFKSARDWQIDAFDANPLPDEYRDANGWPNAMPPGGTVIRTAWAFPEDTPYAEGPWVLTWEGASTFTLGGVSNQVPTDHRIVFDNPNADTFVLEITAITGGGNHARNFVLMLAENEADFNEGKIFSRRFLDLYRGSGGNPLRYMDWMGTNGSDVVDFEDMPPADYFSYTRYGVPLSAIIAMANELDRDPYLCFPHKATDACVTAIATYVRDNLNLNRMAYFEDSNETWNDLFAQRHYRVAQGVAAGWTNPAEGVFGQGMQFCGYRAGQNNSNVRNVYGTDSGERWIGVLGAMPSVPYHTGLRYQGVEYHIANDPGVPEGTTIDKLFSALAITTYFGDNLLTDETNRANLVAYIQSHTQEETFDYIKGLMLDPEFESSIPANTVFWNAQKVLADAEGLKLIAYEGGTHVLHSTGVGASPEQKDIYVPVLLAFSYSSQMADLYDAGFTAWEEITDQPYTEFVLMAPAGASGAFGALRDYDDMNERFGCISSRGRELPFRHGYAGVTAMAA